MLDYLQTTNTLKIPDQNLMLYAVVNYEINTSDFQNIFAWLIFKMVHLPASKFSNRMITPGLNGARSKTGVVSMFPPPLIMKECKKAKKYLSGTKVSRDGELK